MTVKELIDVLSSFPPDDYAELDTHKVSSCFTRAHKVYRNPAGRATVIEIERQPIHGHERITVKEMIEQMATLPPDTHIDRRKDSDGCYFWVFYPQCVKSS